MKLNRILMKKTIKFVVLFAIVLSLFSAYPNKVVDANEGYIVPSLTISNGNENISLDMMKGKHILLTFWASTDGISRVACNEYSAFVKNVAIKEQIYHLSINFDKNNNLFNETVRRDNLNAKTQFNVKGDEAKKIIETFHLEDGYNTLLIDPTGRVIATNPSIKTLQQALSL